MNRAYEKHFIVLDEEDMNKLSAGRMVSFDGWGEDMSPIPIYLCTEEGYKNFQEFWDENL